MKSRFFKVGFLSAIIFLAACVPVEVSDLGLYGSIKDAQTGEALQGVTVKLASAEICSIEKGCSISASLQTISSALGVFGSRTSTVASIKKLAGKEAIKVVFSKSGYQNVVRYIDPKFNANGVVELDDIFLCSNTAPDTDGDTLCDALEDQLSTDSNSVDSDGDGLSDTAEIYGDKHLDLPKLGANPLRKTIFLEMDFYQDRHLSEEEIDELKIAFLDAPLTNPDNSKGIDLIIDHQELIEEYVWPLSEIDEFASGAALFFWMEFDKRIKSLHFNSDRKDIFHYSVKLPKLPGNAFGGLSRGIPASDFVVTNKGNATVMHELGHNLGLFHGGSSAWNPNYAMNYFSIMNYNYSLTGVEYKDGTHKLDYSRYTVEGFSENTMSETESFTPIYPTTEEELEKLAVRFPKYPYSFSLDVYDNASYNFDFNRNQVIDEGVIAADINKNGTTDDVFPQSQNDWENLQFRHLSLAGDSYMIKANLTSLVSTRSLSTSAYEPHEPCPIEHES